ncbi:ASCH domain-containing protein [Flavobacteriaceae bacterium Ap0902]|nr:ASCH domain-containing protein [Flavobacteriaceae bacterium Ap0902]
MSKRLTLNIKQVYFDAILSGEKKVETREIRPSNLKKYCEVDDEGYVIEDENGIVPVRYDEIKLLTGAYSGKRPYMIVKVENAEVILLTDENDEFIELENEKGEVYLAAVIDYALGEITEVFTP